MTLMRFGWYRALRYYRNLFMDLNRPEVKTKKEKQRIRLNDCHCKKRILEIHNYNCDLCGGTDVLQIHHRRYIKGHGRRKYINILCNDCHFRLHTGRLTYREQFKMKLLFFKMYRPKQKTKFRG